MRPDIGRYLEGRLLGTIKLIKTAYDTALGARKDAAVWIDGQELVFGTDPAAGRGFLRLIPQETSIMLGFPRGQELLDPKNRLTGPRNSERRVLIRDSVDFDLYVRRLIDAAASLEG